MFGFLDIPDTVMFCRKGKTQNNNFLSNDGKQSDESSSKLFLLSKNISFPIYEFMPKLFSISTNNCVCHFNLSMLKEVSPVISQYVQDHPNENCYHLNINDGTNVLVKFEELFQGQTVFFDEIDFPISFLITKSLQIKNCPNYLKPESLKTRNDNQNISPQSGVEIDHRKFIEFLKRTEFQTFTIRTHRKEYKCNICGIYSSNIIRQKLEEDPTLLIFEFDYEDENSEFQSICDLFNFQCVNLKSETMYSIKELAERLQINCVNKQIDDFINNYEKFSQKVDEQQKIIDSIDELFDSLYNVRKHGLEKVKFWISHSKWSQTEENVQELAAFILQVVRSSFSLHREMAELIIQLNDESNESNKLGILVPFIVNHLLTFYIPQYSISNCEQRFFDNRFRYSLNQAYFSNNFLNEEENRFVFSFIRVLYKQKIISKEEIKEILKFYDLTNKNFNAFFLPEIIESNPLNIKLLKKDCMSLYRNENENTKNFHLFIQEFLPDKIDSYQKMLDDMEPEDELTKALLHDDVDKLQSIIIKNSLDIPTATVPYNIFDDFDEKPTIINCAALYGSIKCFKYLFLNDGKIDESTLYFAVSGCNNEIIKIVDQESPENDQRYKERYELHGTNSNPGKIKKFKRIKNKQTYFIDYSDDDNIIASAITMHRNDLFDWIYEKRFVSKGKIGNDLHNLAIISASSGNIHSLIEIIDKGLDVSKEIVSLSAKCGFCELSQFLLNIIDQRENKVEFDFESVIQFGNLSLLKLFLKRIDQTNLQRSVVYSIVMNYKSIVDYCFNNIDEINLQLTGSFVEAALSSSFKQENDELFKFLMNKFGNMLPNFPNVYLLRNILYSACFYSNFSAIKIITGNLLKNDPKFDFSSYLLEVVSSGSMTIVQYFIDKKFFIDYNKISKDISKLGLADVKLFEILINNAHPKIRYKFLNCITYAIQKKNKKLIEFLLENKAPINNALLEAVSTHDVEIVDLILKYNSEPSFVNQNQQRNAFSEACINNDLAIVKRLLSVPGIDPNSSYFLNNSIWQLDIDIIDVILNFYGDNTQPLLQGIYTTLDHIVDNFKYHENIDNTPWELIIRLLSIKLIDPNSYFDRSTFLNIACQFNDVETVEKLLMIDGIDPNKGDLEYCQTPLMTTIFQIQRLPQMYFLEGNIQMKLQRNMAIIELLIQHPKTNINYKDSQDKSALDYAVDYRYKEIIEILMNNERFDPIESNLDFIFYLANTESSKILISSPFLDVNHAFDSTESDEWNGVSDESISFDDIKKTALIKSVGGNDIEKINMIISHPSFDKDKSDVNSAIFLAVRDNKIDIFNVLITIINYDVNIHSDLNGESLLAFAANYLCIEIVEAILDNSNFDSNNLQVLDAFVQSYSCPSEKRSRNRNWNRNRNRNNNWGFHNVNHAVPNGIGRQGTIIEIMNQIFDYDEEHSHLIDFTKLLPNGKSFFTSLTNNISEDIIEFLIIHGADPNMPDKNGISPLEHAIILKSAIFAKKLIDTNKIIFSKLEKCNSYLHIAAKFDLLYNAPILNLLLNTNMIDINSVNDNGETPLMIACKAKNCSVIDLLFQKDNLDYLHCDKNGNDALRIVKLLPINEEKEARQSKEAYHKKIISIITELIQKNGSDYLFDYEY